MIWPVYRAIAWRPLPEPWKPEDSLLIIYAMTLDLQDSTGTYELSLATLRDQLGFAGLAFFAPVTLPDDAALDGTAGTLAPRIVAAPASATIASSSADGRDGSSRR